MSAPLCRHGLPQALDCTRLLKLGTEIPYDDDIRTVTMGDWTSRAKGFETLFGEVPPAISSNLKRLERIRKLRNDFAHGFGRSSDAVPGPSNSSAGTMTTLRARAFLTDIGTISKIAASVDKLLLAKFIGNFELLHFYHVWKTKPRIGKEASYSIQRALARSFSRDAKCTVNAAFCAGLIAYYDAAYRLHGSYIVRARPLNLACEELDVPRRCYDEALFCHA
jgi:hypothetical protein